MRTWVLCADQNEARIFQQKEESHGSLGHYRTILAATFATTSASRSSDRFVRYLASELDLACAPGSGGQLILCAQKKLADQVMSRLSPETRDSIVGILGSLSEIAQT